MKFIKMIMCFAAALMLSITPVFAAKTKTIATFKKYNIDGKSGRDQIVLKAYVKDDNYSTLKVYVNKVFKGSCLISNHNYDITEASMVKTSTKDYFILVNSDIAEDDHMFTLFQWKNKKFKVVLNSDQTVKADDYINLLSSSITYSKKKKRFSVRTFVDSNTLTAHNSTILYRIKKHKVVRTSNNVTVPTKTFTAKKKLTVYKTRTSKKVKFTIKRGTKVKVTKYYDNNKKFRVYIKVISNKKTGWVKGIKNGISGTEPFVECGEMDF